MDTFTSKVKRAGPWTAVGYQVSQECREVLIVQSLPRLQKHKQALKAQPEWESSLYPLIDALQLRHPPYPALQCSPDLLHVNVPRYLYDFIILPSLRGHMLEVKVAFDRFDLKLNDGR